MTHIDAELDKQRATEAAAALPPLEADIVTALEKIGIHNPDPTDDLHVRLVAALRRTRGATWGNQLVAVKFEFNAEQLHAGETYARLSVAYQHQVDRRTVALVAPVDGSKGVTRALAEQMVRAADDMYEMQLQVVIAEKREQSMRKYLDTLQAALENHRTDRADQRAGDQYHARSGT